MKKFFISFLLSIVAFAGYAQEYKPLLVEGRTWEVDHREYVGYDEDTDELIYSTCREFYTVNGDTVVAGKTYKKIDVWSQHHLPGAIILAREEDKRVYEYRQHVIESNPNGEFSMRNDVEIVILDFNLTDGEYSEVGDISIMAKTSVVDLYDGAHKSFSFYNGNVVWIEGVGMSSDGVHTNKNQAYSTNYLGRFFKSCYDKEPGEITDDYYSSRDFDKVALGVTDIVKVAKNCKKIYSLSGQQVVSPRKGDVYIQNGKKFIAK